MTLLTLPVTSFADTCRETLADKVATIGGISAVDGGMAIIVTAMAPVVGLPFLGAVEAFWLLFGRRPHRMIQLIDQSQGCHGKLISKAYENYLRAVEKHGGSRIDKADFCKKIVAADLDGSLCSGGTPTIDQVSKYYVN